MTLLCSYLLQAAWDKLCSTSNPDLKGKGKKEGFASFADNLMKHTSRDAQHLGALCKACNLICCDGGLHLHRGGNLGNCTIFCCQAIAFAYMTFIKLMGPPCLANADEVSPFVCAVQLLLMIHF